MKVLITGGAGFIGINLAKELLNKNFEVRILDNFSKQIHGNKTDLGSDLAGAELIVGDVACKKTVASSIEGIETIIHLAAETGTGQSMYEMHKYERTNVTGTLNIIEHLLKKKNSVQKIIVASSRAIYGEGSYLCKEDGLVSPSDRLESDMINGFYEPRCPKCGEFLIPTATKEDSPYNPISYYALTKQIQEQLILMYSKILGISGFALRFQNVYGPHQSLSNPYTGIIAIFSTLARKEKLINIFEDGKESRDFIYIDDAINAISKFIMNKKRGVDSYNIGSGVRTSVIEVAELITDYLNSNSKIVITGDYRVGDIRHNYADIEKIKKEFNFNSKIEFEYGIKNFLDWATREPIPSLKISSSIDELSKVGLLKKSIKK